MRKAFIAVLLLAIGATTASAAVESTSSDPEIVRALRGGSSAGGSAFGTANSNCVAASCDTVWVGHSNAGPGGAFLGVSIGGVWNFDDGIAGTDSTQGWRRWSMHYRSGGTRPAAARPEWALDYGNQINEGNTALWAARVGAGRKFIKTGVAGAWHSDTMVGVKTNIANGAEPSALPIAGLRSAWCGLRESGNTVAQDALTGNYLNGDLHTDQGNDPLTTLSELPGFANLWDQMLYKDFASSGSGTVAFRLATDMSNFVDTVSNGSGWFNPDPTNIANFVNNPADSFMVYVGSPNETAYDTNRRWFSEVLDLGSPHQQLFKVSGKFPFVQADTALSVPYAGITTVGGNVRVVFRVKTNRVRGDVTTGTATGFNSKAGAALLDEVSVNGGAAEGFESVGQVTARSLIADLAVGGGAWATTGKPPAVFFHIENVANLLYEDLCGAVGAPTRTCNLAGNVLVGGNQDNSNLLEIEHFQIAFSPTVDLAVRSAAPGTKNTQGIDKETAQRTSAMLEFDFYSGNMDLDESIFYRYAARAYAPATYKQPISARPVWSNANLFPFIIFNPDPFCYRDFQTLGVMGIPVGSVDSLKIGVGTHSFGWRFGGTNLGNTRGTYFDNLRLGLIRGGELPPLAQEAWNKLQDQFPWNEAITPGDNASFDTTAALMRSGLNIVAPANAVGVVAGDTMAANSPFVGDGIATGVRLDLIFRIDPGPGNYVIKGNRASALVNRDPAHPFFASYLANNGTFGTPGGHGGTWNRHVWNSARMDSAENNTYPINSRGIGNPGTPVWMGALHESDPRFVALGIDHSVCFLVDPNGTTDESNLDCSGTPPIVYGAVSGTTKEGTKIIPDGWLTPGSHVEYFLRRSTIEAPASFAMLYDTTTVFTQDPAGFTDSDADRWSSADVLPDMWKSGRYGGAGLACMLMIDGNDRRGAERAYMGAADSAGYGKNNGAKKGWKGLGAGSDPNDPAGFVAANLGQAGLNFDLYEIKASESVEAGHPGVRFASNTGGIALKGDKSGPSALMLGNLYSTVLHFAGDLSGGTVHDGFDSQEGADDIALYDGFLAGATGANRRGLWLSGDGIMEDAAINSDNGTFLYPFLTDVMGSDLQAANYKAYSGSNATTVGFLPSAAWANPGRVYGINHLCTILADVLLPVSTVDGAATAANYQALGAGTEFSSSVYRPTGTTREFRTLVDGFDLTNLRGDYANLAAIATQLGTDNGRIAWFNDVVTGHFQICARVGPVVSVGDQQGVDAGRFSNMNLGAFPNPAFAAKNVTLRFTLAKAQNVTVRIYNVAGREVANFSKNVVEAGPVNIVWDGKLSNGAKATPGVYFYRVDGVEFGGASAPNKMILLSSAE